MISSAVNFVAESVPAPIRHLIAYPINQLRGEESSLSEYNQYEHPLYMARAAIRIALAAKVLLALPQFTGSLALGLAGGAVFSTPVTFLVGGSLLLKAAWITLQGAIATASIPLAAQAALIGYVGYQVINNYQNAPCLFPGQGLAERYMIRDFGVLAEQLLPARKNAYRFRQF